MAAVILAGGVLVANVGPANASQPGTLRVQLGPNPILRFDAGDFAANGVVIRPKSSGGFNVEDNKAALKLIGTPNGCAQVNEHVVHCPSIANLTVRAHLGNEDDTFYNLGADNTVVFGGNGRDWLYGGEGTDYLYGDGDEDKVYGLAGADHLFGGLANDKVTGGPGNDTLEGDEGVDTVSGDAGKDTLTNHGGGYYQRPDKLFGGADDDILDDTNSGSYRTGVWHGGDGNDRFLVGQLSEGNFHGDGGTDTAVYSEHDRFGAMITLDGHLNDTANCGGYNQVCPGDHNVHSDIENVVGTKFNDRIIGNGAINNIDAGDGNDTIDGKAGNDYLDAGDGYWRVGDDSEQRVYGGDGVDKCRGWSLAVRDHCEG